MAGNGVKASDKPATAWHPVGENLSDLEVAVDGRTESVSKIGAHELHPSTGTDLRGWHWPVRQQVTEGKNIQKCLKIKSGTGQRNRKTIVKKR